MKKAKEKSQFVSAEKLLHLNLIWARNVLQMFFAIYFWFLFRIFWQKLMLMKFTKGRKINHWNKSLWTQVIVFPELKQHCMESWIYFPDHQFQHENPNFLPSVYLNLNWLNFKKSFFGFTNTVRDNLMKELLTSIDWYSKFCTGSSSSPFREKAKLFYNSCQKKT